MDKTKRKTFMFIPSELTELSLLRNQKSNFSNTTDFYSLGYKIPEIYGNQSNDSEVVLILGFYDSFTEKNEVCPYCCVKIQSNDDLHICAQSLKKYKFDRSCIKPYYPLLTNESYIWISLDMNKLPSLLKHGILMKYSRLFYSQNHNWLYSIMNYEIGQSLCTLILWSNQFTLDYNTSCCDQLNYERNLVIFCAIQLLILMLCLITVPHNHYHHHSDNNYDFGYCTPHVNKSSSQLSSCNTIQSNYHTITTTTTTTNTAISSSWLPNDLNCKIIPTLGLFYLDKNEENYTLALSSTNLSSSSSSPFILYNSTKELMNYLSPSTDYCQMNILYRYIEVNTIELITLHLTSFYIYATHLLRLQLKTIAASWRLCRNSSKWNPLRNRVDKIPDMYLDSNEFFLSVSSLQKKISSSSSSSSPSSPTILSTATTTPGFFNDKNHCQKQQSERSIVRQENVLYKFISHKKDSDIILCDQLTKQTCGVQLVLLLIKNSLKNLVWFIMDFPLESLICWLLNSSNYQTKLILEAPRMDSKYFPFLQLKVTRIDFSEMYHQNHLLHKPLFPSNSLSFMEIFYRLLSAQDIR
uniref:Uncharacterized protein n=1 Tax=Schistosoma haematobium TaxID=6185 RepID=A0A095BZY5_SCHHA